MPTAQTLLLSALLAAPLVPRAAAASPVAPPAARAGKPEVEVVQVPTEDGIQLQADFYVPKESTTRAPAAILVHDAGGDRSQLTLIAERLQGRGLAVLVPDLRGHGESATPEDAWKSLDDEARSRQWAYTSRDLEAAAKWLKSRGEVHTSNLTMLGLRAGCALAVYHAARDGQVRAVVLIEPATEQLGFDLRREVAGLAGLETKVFTSKDKESEAQIIQANATKANDGLEFIDIDLCRTRSDDLVNDRRVATEVSKWVEDRVFLRKGRR
jgi:dienelactone hydrolase